MSYLGDRCTPGAGPLLLPLGKTSCAETPSWQPLDPSPQSYYRFRRVQDEQFSMPMSKCRFKTVPLGLSFPYDSSDLQPVYRHAALGALPGGWSSRESPRDRGRLGDAAFLSGGWMGLSPGGGCYRIWSGRTAAGLLCAVFPRFAFLPALQAAVFRTRPVVQAAADSLTVFFALT